MRRPSQYYALRHLEGRLTTPLGQYKTDLTPCTSFPTAAAPYRRRSARNSANWSKARNIALDRAPVLAATNASGARAIGQPSVTPGNKRTLLLADAVMNYHFSFAVGDRREALVHFHRVLLLVQGHISSLGEYLAYVEAQGLEDGRWAASAIALANSFRFDPNEKADAWLERVRECAGADAWSATGRLSSVCVPDQDLGKSLQVHPRVRRLLGPFTPQREWSSPLLASL